MAELLDRLGASLPRTLVVRRPVARACCLLPALLFPVACAERRPAEELGWDEDAVDSVVVSERVVLGGSDASGPSAFAAITSVALLPSLGRIAVADGTTDQLHVFLLDGTHLWTAGGRGFGPGEFRALNRIGAMPDGTLCAWDIAILRMTLFDTLGSPASTAPVSLGEAWELRPPVVGIAEGCAIVVRDERTDILRSAQPEGLYQDTVRFGLYASADGAWKWLAELRNAPRWLYRMDRGWGSQDLIFGRRRLATLAGRELVIVNTDSLAWTRIGLDGAVIARAALPVGPRAVESADVEIERERLADSIAAHYSGRGLARMILTRGLSEAFSRNATHGAETAPAESTFPAVDQFTAASNGVLWFRLFRHRQDRAARWLALDLQGRPLGRLSLPATAALVAASHNWIVVQDRDAFDAPMLRILAIDGGLGPPDP